MAQQDGATPGGAAAAQARLQEGPAAPGRGRHLRHAPHPDHRRLRGRWRCWRTRSGRGPSPARCFGATLLLALHTSHVRGTDHPHRRGRRRRDRRVADRARDHRPRAVPGRDRHRRAARRRHAGRDPGTGSSGTRDQHRDDPRRDRRVPAGRHRVRGGVRRMLDVDRLAVLRAGPEIRGEVPLLQLRGDHDARLRRPHPAHRHRAGDRQPRGAARPAVPGDGRGGARREPRSRARATRSAQGRARRRNPRTERVSGAGRRTGTSRARPARTSRRRRSAARGSCVPPPT